MHAHTNVYKGPQEVYVKSPQYVLVMG